MDLFDEVFQYLKTISPEMLVTHDGDLKRFILTKPKSLGVENDLNTILKKHHFNGKLTIKERDGYLNVIYCFESGLDDPELMKYFKELEEHEK